MRLSRAELRAHLVDELLPLWERHGLDRTLGGYWNRLGPDLRPTPDGFKRLLVHARQLFAFTRAQALGASDWARAAAAHGLEFLATRFWDSRHGGWFTRTSDAGEPFDRRKDLYDHAFAMFALAEHHRVTRERESLRLARETWALVRERLRDPKHGGFFEGASDDWRPLAGLRRQNPHMHLFEALLSLHEVAPADGALAEASALVELLGSRWSDSRSGALGEHFGASWKPAPGAPGRVVEPGHGFEWFGLLARYAELGGAGSARELAQRLFDFASRHGVDADGGVFDQVDREGAVLTATKRLWPQTERLKALSVSLRLRPDPARRAQLEVALRYCAERHIEPATRGWREQLSREGESLANEQNATSVYHVVTAFEEAIRVAD
jgi:mannose/cellobiose epimerase-like protein (N-acyl-D-glucosamine 2-epimerase family)